MRCPVSNAIISIDMGLVDSSAITAKAGPDMDSSLLLLTLRGQRVSIHFSMSINDIKSLLKVPKLSQLEVSLNVMHRRSSGTIPRG